MSEDEAIVVICNDVIHFRPIARLKDLGRRLDIDIYLSYQGETFSNSNIIAITAWELQRGWGKASRLQDAKEGEVSNETWIITTT